MDGTPKRPYHFLCGFQAGAILEQPDLFLVGTGVPGTAKKGSTAQHRAPRGPRRAGTVSGPCVPCRRARASNPIWRVVSRSNTHGDRLWFFFRALKRTPDNKERGRPHQGFNIDALGSVKLGLAVHRPGRLHLWPMAWTMGPRRNMEHHIEIIQLR